MDDKRFTEDGLPVVTGEVIDSFTQEVSRDHEIGLDSEEYRLEKFRMLLREENPALSMRLEDIIKDYSGGDENREYYLAGYLLGTMFTYEGLRQQAKADNLNDNLNLD